MKRQLSFVCPSNYVPEFIPSLSRGRFAQGDNSPRVIELRHSYHRWDGAAVGLGFGIVFKSLISFWSSLDASEPGFT
jgi:hypothetical protein